MLLECMYFVFSQVDDYQYTFLQGPNLVINQPDEVLNNMGEWCTQHNVVSSAPHLSRIRTHNVSDDRH